MAVDQLIERCRAAAGIDPEQPHDEDSLIGFFQMFRPDGRGLAGIFADLPDGPELHARLEQLYEIAGDDRRPQGGRDAYFVNRSPVPADSGRIQTLAEAWLANMRELATELDESVVAAALNPLPIVRVLEGLPPKNPKREDEKTDLLVTFQSEMPGLTKKIRSDGVQSEQSETLRQAYYFVSCDAMLRDYLMWPLHAPAVGTGDPFAPYFELWKHGIKFRIFREDQIDFYMPRYGLTP